MWTCAVLMVLLLLLIISLFFVFVGLHFNRPSAIKHHVIALVIIARTPPLPIAVFMLSVYKSLVKWYSGGELAVSNVYNCGRDSQWSTLPGGASTLPLLLLTTPIRLHLWIRRVEGNRASISSALTDLLTVLVQTRNLQPITFLRALYSCWQSPKSCSH